MGMKVTGHWEIMHFPTPPFLTDFEIGHGINRVYTKSVTGDTLNMSGVPNHFTPRTEYQNNTEPLALHQDMPEMNHSMVHKES